MRPSSSLWLIIAITTIPLRAQFTSSLCPNVQLGDADFEATDLFNRKGTGGAAKDADLVEPVQFDVLVVKNAGGKYDHSDIVFVERTGNVKYFDGAAKTVKEMGTIEVHTAPGAQDDNGLMGVAFDPGFATNRWIYVWYSPKQTFNQAMTGTGQNRQLRLTRFQVKPDNTLDMASEKILIKILGSKTDQWHSGGPMQFDAYGDLWVAVGNNSIDLNPSSCNTGGSVLSQTDSTQSSEWGPSNTHSLRGGFFRIHPDDAAPKGYTIPPGNFGAYWADQFEKQGNATLAAQYRDTSKVLPEVYVKGERSNYSCAVHPTKRWLAWGTVNYASSNDEFNITKYPVFTGFPYFHNNNLPTCSHGKTVEKPTNNSKFNSGVVDLPPAFPGAINNLVNVAIGGPIYNFDPSLDYEFKFPPHFDNKWFIGSFSASRYFAVAVDTSGPNLKASGTPVRLDQTGLFKNVSIRNYMHSIFGKDGALYILNYDGGQYSSSPANPGVVRVIYKGACQVPVSARTLTPPYQSIWIDPTGITVKEAGPHIVTLFDLIGHQVWRDQGLGPRVYRFRDFQARAGMRSGIYLARVQTPVGEVSSRVSLF
ncbi:MAG: PQQ-dependent sugar dehydrogenase [Fibrobacteria bacterium]